MGEIAVFVPGQKSKLHRDALLPLGLGSLIDERVAVQAFTGPGPNDMHGVHFRFTHDNEPEYSSATIDNSSHWQPLAKDGELKAGRAWIGWNKDDPPGPMDLLRKKQHEGAYVKLGDGNVWQVPIARQLPCVLGINDEGEVCSRPVERYRNFWERSQQAIHWFEETSEGKLRLDFDQSFQFALDALCINYRLTRDLLAALNLVTTDNVYEMAIAICEWREIVAALSQKKTDSLGDTQPTFAGASA